MTVEDCFITKLWHRLGSLVCVHTLFQKSDAKIQITITMAYLIRTIWKIPISILNAESVTNDMILVIFL